MNEGDRQLIQSVDYCREHYEMCVRELHEMENAKFYNNVSVFDMVMATPKAVSGFARNEELIEALEGGVYETHFPLYFPGLKRKFDAEVDRQKFRSAAAKALNDVFEFNDPFHIVNQMILGYMSDDNLIFLQI